MSDKIVQFNKEVIKGQLKEQVRGSIEETLNELLEKKPKHLHKQLVVMSVMKRARVIEADTMIEGLQRLPAVLRYIYLLDFIISIANFPLAAAIGSPPLV